MTGIDLTTLISAAILALIPACLAFTKATVDLVRMAVTLPTWGSPALAVGAAFGWLVVLYAATAGEGYWRLGAMFVIAAFFVGMAATGITEWARRSDTKQNAPPA